jgi:hypothetical protein
MTSADVRRGQRLWKEMKDAGVNPDIVSYNTMLNLYVRSSEKRVKRDVRNRADNHVASEEDVEAMEALLSQLRQDSNVLPNRITYLAFVNFWTGRGYTERAESFILDMVKICKDYNNDDPKQQNNVVLPPERDMFHRVMNAWANQKAPRKAEALLLKMAEMADSQGLKLRPTVETYNQVILAWAKSGQRRSGERAEMILREMEALSDNGDEEVTPNVYTYNNVLNAWASSRDPTAVTRTDSLVLEMILKRKPNLMPDAVSYGTWLKAITLSEETDKARRAQDVVKMMKIHNFIATDYLLEKINDLSNPSGT